MSSALEGALVSGILALLGVCVAKTRCAYRHTEEGCSPTCAFTDRGLDALLCLYAKSRKGGHAQRLERMGIEASERICSCHVRQPPLVVRPQAVAPAYLLDGLHKRRLHLGVGGHTVPMSR